MLERHSQGKTDKLIKWKKKRKKNVVSHTRRHDIMRVRSGCLYLIFKIHVEKGFTQCSLEKILIFMVILHMLIWIDNQLQFSFLVIKYFIKKCITWIIGFTYITLVKGLSLSRARLYHINSYIKKNAKKSRGEQLIERLAAFYSG